MATLYIITGSNGAGKSSIGANYLPTYLEESCIIFDGDKLFMQKQKELWQQGIKAHKEARKLAFEYVENTFDSLVQRALINNNDFVYEGHFTNNATWDVPKTFKDKGYSINLIFFGLTDTNLSGLRVIDRLKEGGHYVNNKTIADNFFGNLEKMDIYYKLFDTVQIIDTSQMTHKILVTLTNGNPTYSVAKADFPDWFIKNLPIIFSLLEF